METLINKELSKITLYFMMISLKLIIYNPNYRNKNIIM